MTVSEKRAIQFQNLENFYLLALELDKKTFSDNDITFMAFANQNDVVISVHTENIMHQRITILNNESDYKFTKECFDLFEYAVVHEYKMLKAEEEYQENKLGNHYCDKYHSEKEDSI